MHVNWSVVLWVLCHVRSLVPKEYCTHVYVSYLQYTIWLSTCFIWAMFGRVNLKFHSPTGNLISCSLHIKRGRIIPFTNSETLIAEKQQQLRSWLFHLLILLGLIKGWLIYYVKIVSCVADIKMLNLSDGLRKIRRGYKMHLKLRAYPSRLKSTESFRRFLLWNDSSSSL